MNLEATIAITQSSLARMNSAYGRTVFDEWAILALLDNKARILYYQGPRKEAFQENFIADAREIRGELFRDEYGHGDFFFDRHGSGTHFDGFMVLGEGLFLICNHTTETMERLTAAPKWLGAQKFFVELSEKLRSRPLVHPM